MIKKVIYNAEIHHEAQKSMIIYTKSEKTGSKIKFVWKRDHIFNKIVMIIL